jgi:hypothetical protein
MTDKSGGRKKSTRPKTREDVDLEVDTYEAPLPFPDMAAGAQVDLVLLKMAPAPKAILSLKEKGLGQRAEQAWKSVFLLRMAIQLWDDFLLFGHVGMRLGNKSEERISEFFPALRDIGVVLEAFVVQPKLDGDSEAKRQDFDRMFGIVRGPSKQLKKSERAYYQGTGLQTLIQAFQQTILTQAQCLNAVGIQSAMFGKSPDAIEEELSKITRIYGDCTREALPLDFGRKRQDHDYQTTCARVHRELDRLRNLLEESPAIVLGEPQSKPSRRGQWAHKGPPPPEEYWRPCPCSGQERGHHLPLGLPSRRTRPTAASDPDRRPDLRLP